MDLSNLHTFRVAACDLNGQMRGKRVPSAYAAKLDTGAVRMPFSALNVDLWGADIDGSPLVFESGDADGVLRPTGRGPVPVPWIDAPTALVPMSMHHDDGQPFAGDPRHALATVLDRYAARGWSVIAATELEFTLLDASSDTPRPPVNPLTGRRLEDEAVLSMAEMDAFDAFFTELYDGCEAMGIPAQTAISESGIGQFEINLNHQEAMRCADDTWLFKALVRGLARKHGFAATFMAKPYPDDAGNGMHVHFSVVDSAGNNVLDDGGPQGTDTLRHAVAGCLAAMPASTLIFAPHGNSYTRLVPGAHAPTGACWAYENRTAAIRIPGGAPAARRIEHRVAGGDTNPYLMLAAILGAALAGIEDSMQPPAPITGNAYEIDGLPQLAADWPSAITRFEADPLIARILPADLIRYLAMTKRQEIARFAERAPETHWLSYLEAV
ncbi:glutamine synthetase family protein [Ruegeria sp. HKCCD8929]|uniref:glutamine synthetase family protein n=1 Tax=Ruegeria sp. HKCCD8929 TaxID=2683006 RepID=UPI0014890333|nr:glutamine synthetase family protein [Ruegeria sp. HKCCD8929]